MDNYHRAPAQFLRATLMPEDRPGYSRGDHPAIDLLHLHTIDRARLQEFTQHLDAAQDQFEIVNGRAVQVRTYAAGLPIGGGS
jgi:hypothetical protein